MSSSHPGANTQSWRNDLFTFADENQRVFTVTNCPPLIHPIPHIPDTPDGDILVNPTLGTLSRPQISIAKYPELALLLRTPPLADPLLSRICVDANSLVPIRYDRGWGLKEAVRNSWIALEKGLLHISELLLTSTHDSSAGTSARYAIRSHEHWPPPQDYGYHDMHTSAAAADRSIRRAVGAFQVLVARCSLAIALWQFPGPIKGQIRPVSNVRYDAVSRAVVPEWVVHLREHDVPSSWIDALCDSVITDFSINMRVGTVFVPKDCPWVTLAPVLKGANVPVFVFWDSPSAVQQCIATHPFMSIFAPSLDDPMHARRNPPAGQPRVVTLWNNATPRRVPDHSVFDGTIPPFGAYQLPGESRTEFFARRERYRVDQNRRESLIQREQRRTREVHAESGSPPNRRSRVYMWVRPEFLFPDMPPAWTKYEYRFSVPPAAYKSLWMVHPPNLRQYNAYYDEWDLWFPVGWGTDQDADLTPSANVATISPPSRIASSGRHHQPLEDEQELLNPTPEDHETHDVHPHLGFLLHSWYGLQVTSTRTFSGVDYESWARDIWHMFGETKERFPEDDATQKSVAGWVSAVMDREWASHALENTWDLDARHPQYLLGSQRSDPRLAVTLDHLKACPRKDDPDNTQCWVWMKFHEDPPDQPWSLLTSALGALMVIRRFPEATTSSDALHSLLCAGIPARTGVRLTGTPLPTGCQPYLTLRRLSAPWRHKREQPTVRDYNAYCQRVLELSASPHMRAAWLKGGIVWRIMVEVTEKHPNAHVSATHLEELQKGPSALHDHHQAVTVHSQEGAYYDDSLSSDELNIIAGVVRVYTGRGDQTEDISWWPKHSAWTKAAGYTGIWSPGDEAWFQRRLKAIYEGKEGPLNAGEWKNKMRRQKKAGSLRKVLEERAWDFTYRNFVKRE